MKPHTKTFTLPQASFEFASFAWPRFVATLPSGDKAKRLADYKRPFCGPTYHSPKPEDAGKGSGFYHCSPCKPFSLRWDYCDEVNGSGIDHTGWFADDFQDTKIRGLVFRLPRGHGFLAGWTMGKDMSSAIECDIYDSAIEAARAADSLAEDVAEKEREYQEKDQEAQRLEREKEEAEETLAASREEARAMLSEIHDSSLSPALCERLKGQLKDLRRAMHSAFQEIAKLNDQLASNS